MHGTSIVGDSFTPRWPIDEEFATHTWRDIGQREPVQIRAFLLATVRRVIVAESSVQLALSRSGLRTVLLRGTDIPSTRLTSLRCLEEQDDLIQVSISVRFTRCGGGIRLIVPGESGEERTPTPNAALIKAVARAHVWYERLLSGEVTSLRAIAREHGVTENYVGRVLRCAFLAPDLVEAILRGRQPPELTLAQLCYTLPLDWAEQRHSIGLI